MHFFSAILTYLTQEGRFFAHKMSGHIVTLVVKVYKDGIVVGREALLKLPETDFLRGIWGFLALFSGFCRHPIAIGKHAITLYIKAGRYEHVVYATVGLQLRIEAVERAVFGKPAAGFLITVIE